MADLDIQVTVSRPGTDLDLNQDGSFEVIAVGVGGRTWQRRTVDGPYMHGRRLLGAVLASQTLVVLVRVRGATWVAAQNRYQEMAEAFSQQAYTVTQVLEGRTDTYTCEPADIALTSGATLSKHHVMAQMQEYQVTIPIDPVGA